MSVYINFLTTVSFAESFTPTSDYLCHVFLVPLFVVKATSMLWLCSSAEADLETLLDLRWNFSRQ